MCVLLKLLLRAEGSCGMRCVHNLKENMRGFLADIYLSSRFSFSRSRPTLAPRSLSFSIYQTIIQFYEASFEQLPVYSKLSNGYRHYSNCLNV